MDKNLKKGIYFALITAIISGFSIFYNKLVLIKGIDSLVFNIIKNGGVSFILLLIIFSSSQTRINLKNSLKKDYKKLFLIGLVGGSIPFFLFFEGLKQTTAINGALIHKTLFIWVAAIAIPFLNEKLSVKQVLGYILVIYANLFIGGFSAFKGNLGEIMIFAATILWSIEIVLAKIFIKNLDSIVIAYGRMFFGTLILIAFAAFQNKLLLFANLKLEQALPIIGSILFLTGYVLAFYKALKLAPVTLVSSILIISTPITNILTTIFITHSLPNTQILNLLITTLGVLLITLFSYKPKVLEKTSV